MEWWKLFSGTFILIFLAELGDKTQLAAMAKTADSPDGSSAKWVVFLGASLALVASTFIAVFLGNTLRAFVPDERYIKIAAGFLFLVFGLMILHETYRSYRPLPETTRASGAPSAGAAEQHGLAGELALRAAMDFEAFAGDRYRRLAANASRHLSGVLLDLAREEDGHLARLLEIPGKDKGTGIREAVPRVEARVTEDYVDDPGTLAELIRHENATAEFYQALADRTLIPSVKAVFSRLANEERGHAGKLAALANAARAGDVRGTP